MRPLAVKGRQWRGTPQVLSDHRLIIGALGSAGSSSLCTLVLMPLVVAWIRAVLATPLWNVPWYAWVGLVACLCWGIVTYVCWIVAAAFSKRLIDRMVNDLARAERPARTAIPELD